MEVITSFNINFKSVEKVNDGYKEFAKNVLSDERAIERRKAELMAYIVEQLDLTSDDIQDCNIGIEVTTH